MVSLEIYPDPEDSSADDLSSSEAEEVTLPASGAYHTLLHAYQSSNKPARRRGESHGQRRKRQKLDHHSPLPTQRTVSAGASAEELEAALGREEHPGGESDEELGDGVPVEEGQDEKDGADSQPKANPFEYRFATPDETDLAQRVKRIAEKQWTTQKLESAGGARCVLQTPVGAQVVPARRIRSSEQLRLKQRLVENANKLLGQFSPLEQDVVPALFDYCDILFGARTVENAERMRLITCLHALNHLLNTRDRVLKNNAKIAAATEDDDREYRDQGFTRPKVLFLLETKQACVRFIDAITKLYDFEQQENKKRFMDSFSLPEDKFSDDKPTDFREVFEGNDENEFRIGVKLARKTLKLYSTFYNSDIIFASGLGLRRTIESGNAKKRDYDFLSSVELVVMDQADATLMQNWEHTEYVFEHLNLQPKDAHGCDFSRVRSWYLDGHAGHVRQTILLSAYLTPQINTLHNKHMRNVAGRLKYTPDYTSGSIESLPYNNIKQTFSRFDSPSHLSDPDSRFKFFNSTILPQVTRLPTPSQGGLGVLVFIPSYLDFVRVRNSLVDSDFSYASISEYTDPTSVRKARSHFMTGRHNLLLYTGRAHHFHRYNIRGVKRAVFYGLPENPKFYEEIVGFIGKSIERGEVSKAETRVNVCFSRWEKLELERIVGSKRIDKMVKDKGDVFDFV